MKLLFCVFCILLLSSCVTTTSTPVSNIRDYVYPVHSIVRNLDNTTELVGSSSVVVIAPNYGITTLHSMIHPDQRTQWIVLSESTAREITIIQQDVDNDIALVKGDFNCPCARIDANSPPVDSAVDVVGYPLGMLLKTQFKTKGNFQGTTDKGHYITTSNVAVGMSGGGIFVNDKLVGIITGYTGAEGGDLTWISYGAPLPAIKALYQHVK